MQSILKIVLVLFCVGALTGCAGVSYAVNNYAGIEPVNWTYEGTPYRVFDKPDEGRMMITAGFGDAAAMGFTKGLTLGLIDTDFPGVQYSEAALAWLESQGRTCTANIVSLIITPQWEVQYEC